MQIFGELQYQCVVGQSDVRYILDLGGNIGCASYYLLSHYREAQAVVVEPDPGNMSICRWNLAPFADRIIFVQAGVWSESVPMVVERGRYRTGDEMAFQVRPARGEEQPDFLAKTVADLLAESGFPRVDILKMDIEAAEAEVFRNGAPDWLSRVRTMAVELHGPDCEAAVESAAATIRHEVRQTGEITTYSFSPLPAPVERVPS